MSAGLRKMSDPMLFVVLGAVVGHFLWGQERREDEGCADRLP